MTRWWGWIAVAAALVVLWTVVLQPAADGQEERSTPGARRNARPAAEAPVKVRSRDSQNRTASPEELRRERRLRGLVSGVTIFVIAIFLGVELIGRVPATLHTPLMSGSNAISGITVVGAIIAAGVGGRVAPFLGFVAVVLAMINVAGGFLVTHRMLMIFKRR